MSAPICPYCGATSKLVTGASVYPHKPELSELPFYRCEPCDAHVGCHPGSTRPLGIPANAELRRQRLYTHSAFDPLWRGKNAIMERGEAYAWLADTLHIDPLECHIGLFDEQTCRDAREASRSLRYRIAQMRVQLEFEERQKELKRQERKAKKAAGTIRS